MGEVVGKECCDVALKDVGAAVGCAVIVIFSAKPLDMDGNVVDDVWNCVCAVGVEDCIVGRVVIVVVLVVPKGVETVTTEPPSYAVDAVDSVTSVVVSVFCGSGVMVSVLGESSSILYFFVGSFKLMLFSSFSEAKDGVLVETAVGVLESFSVKTVVGGFGM